MARFRSSLKTLGLKVVLGANGEACSCMQSDKGWKFTSLKSSWRYIYFDNNNGKKNHSTTCSCASHLPVPRSSPNIDDKCSFCELSKGPFRTI
ncbi:hypothetical protein DFH27DRAFT_579868, partial [Peziza echinospora]